MRELKLQQNLADPDAIYEWLVQAHEDLTAEQSRKFDAALVLILSNHVGETAIIEAAIDAARRAVVAAESESSKGKRTDNNQQE